MVEKQAHGLIERIGAAATLEARGPAGAEQHGPVFREGPPGRGRAGALLAGRSRGGAGPQGNAARSWMPWGTGSSTAESGSFRRCS